MYVRMQRYLQKTHAPVQRGRVLFFASGKFSLGRQGLTVEGEGTLFDYRGLNHYLFNFVVFATIIIRQYTPQPYEAPAGTTMFSSAPSKHATRSSREVFEIHPNTQSDSRSLEKVAIIHPYIIYLPDAP